MKNENAIGGYFEYELISRRSREDGALLFNTGRSAFAYLLKSYQIDFIQIPYYTCDVVLEPLHSLGIGYSFYSLTQELLPDLENGEVDIERPMLVNNYYGLLDEVLKGFPLDNAIIDNSQALFSALNGGFGSFNSYRKFMGIPDGAEARPGRAIKTQLDYSIYPRYRCAENLDYLFGRIENGPEAFYSEFKNADKALKFSGINKISEVSLRSLDSIDQDSVRKKRMDNFDILQNALREVNEFPVKAIAAGQVPMAYPLLIDKGSSLRERLIEERIFVPTFWPNEEIPTHKGSFEEYLKENLLPLPVDQRYSGEEMNRIINTLEAIGN